MVFTLRRPERSAAPSIRGYFAQILYGTLRWLDLSTNEVLICEGNEDIVCCLLDDSGNVREVTEEQIKLLERSISARDEDVYESIFNFLRAFHDLHVAGTRCALVFTTTATRARQQITDTKSLAVRAKDSPHLFIDVLDTWQSLTESSDEGPLGPTIQALAESIRSLSSHHLPSDPAIGAPISNAQANAGAVRAALRYLDDGALWTEFLQSVRWNLGQKTLSGLQAEIVEKLKAHPLAHELPSDVLAERLIIEVLVASGGKAVESRALDVTRLSDICASTRRGLDEWSKTRQLSNIWKWFACLEQRIAELTRRIDEVSGRLDHVHSRNVEMTVPASLQSVEEFRRRLLSYPRSRDRADLSLVRSKAAGALSPHVVYQPLRLLQRVPQGAPAIPASTIGAGELLSRSRPMVVRGPGGAGKTTWLEHTFRELLETAEILPVLIILRNVAHEWANVPGERSVESCLRRWASARDGSNGEDVIRSAIAFPQGPRLALFVDGWDELGEVGDEFREKFLAFKVAHPGTLLVATSRPYDSSQPTPGDGFDVFDLLPLSEEEILALARRYVTSSSGTGKEAEDHLSRFETAFQRSEQVQGLSQTPLLLTMLLRLSKVDDLPENRYLLYKRCVHDLLTRSELKLKDGAGLPWDQWHSGNGDENLMAAARLAMIPLSADGPTTGKLLMGEKELLAALPGDWPSPPPNGLTTFAAQQYFIRWLAGAAGLLNETQDGVYEFAHRSLQEYLATVHLDSEFRDTFKTTEFARRATQERQWDVLVHWAGVMSESDAATLNDTLERLISDGGLALDLAGTILAEGLGSDAVFEKWVREYIASVKLWVRFQGFHCEQAWALSHNEKRKEALALAIADSYQDALFPVGSRLLGVARHCYLKLPERVSRGDGVTKAIWEVLKGVGEERSHIAVGRIFSGADAGWPSYKSELAMLNLWPSHRRIAGLRFQLAVACGASRSDLRELSPLFLAPPKWDEASRKVSENITGYLNELVPYRRPPENWPENPDDEVIRRAFVAAAARRAALRWLLPWVPPPTIALSGAMSVPTGLHGAATNWSHHAFSPERNIRRALQVKDVPDESCRWRFDLHLADSLSFGIYGARGAFATRGYLGTCGYPLLAFMGPACRLSLEPHSDPADMEREILLYEDSGGDHLWTALARHIARRSADADRDLLAHLAANPSERSGPLRWGLQYVVRGDVMLADGHDLTLDQLASEAGTDPLPLLENEPDESEATN